MHETFADVVDKVMANGQKLRQNYKSNWRNCKSSLNVTSVQSDLDAMVTEKPLAEVLMQQTIQ